MVITSAQPVLAACRVKTELNDIDSFTANVGNIRDSGPTPNQFKIAETHHWNSLDNSYECDSYQSSNSEGCGVHSHIGDDCDDNSAISVSALSSSSSETHTTSDMAEMKTDDIPVTNNYQDTTPTVPSALPRGLSRKRTKLPLKTESNSDKLLHDLGNNLWDSKDSALIRNASAVYMSTAQHMPDHVNYENSRLSSHPGVNVPSESRCSSVFGNNVASCFPLPSAEEERGDATKPASTRLSFEVPSLHKRKRPRFLSGSTSYCDLTGSRWHVADSIPVSKAYDITPLSATPENVNRLCVGMFVYVVSEVNLNREAEYAHLAKVLFVDRSLSYPRFLIHYIGWQSSHDEWICADVMFAVVCSFGVGSKLFRRLNIAGYTQRAQLDYCSLQPSVDLSTNNICFFASLRKQPFIVNDDRIMALKQEAAAVSPVNTEVLRR